MKFNKAILVFFGIIILLVFVFSISFLKNTGKGPLTGHVALNLNSYYKEGNPLNGTLGISLKQGELLPTSSKIIIENGNQTFEYELKELVAENPELGNFYIDGKTISGSGEGYGFIGEKTSYPTIYFTLDVSGKNSLDETTNIIAEETNQQNTGSNEVSGTVENQQQETNQETTSPVPESVKEEESKTEVKEEKKEEKKENKESEKEEKVSKQGLTLTGNVITDFSKGFYISFLRLVGFASLNNDVVVDGKVSKGQEFIYNFEEGQKIKIVKGSVRNENGEIPESFISLNIEGKKAIVTTEYSETETGFGEEYIGADGKTLSIDLLSLGFTPESGELKIKLVYGEEEIVSLSTSLIEGILNETNFTQVENQTLENETVLEIVKPILTEEERQILINEFGNSSLEITKAEKTGNEYVVRFEIGGFWIEHTYPLDYSQEQLQEQVQNDIVLFLKDLAMKFSSENTQPEEVSGLIGSYKI